MILKTSFLALLAYSSAHAKPLEIIATTGMVADITRQVAGNHATVTSLMGEGVTRTFINPQQRTLRQLFRQIWSFTAVSCLKEECQIHFSKRQDLAKLSFQLRNSSKKHGCLNLLSLRGTGTHMFWMDVSAWSQAVEAVAKALCDEDSDNCADYKRNAKAYRTKLKNSMNMQLFRSPLFLQSSVYSSPPTMHSITLVARMALKLSAFRDFQPNPKRALRM